MPILSPQQRRRKEAKKAGLNLDLKLHDKQGKAFNSKATEILYGGALGGGKSYLMRVVAFAWASQIANLNVYLFRRLLPDLIKNHMEGPTGFRALLAPLVDKGYVTIVEDEIRFNWNGSKIFLCHCKDEKDKYKYQGAEIHVLLIDEGTHFTESQYKFLRTRVRQTSLKLPQSLKHRFPRILVTANPGGVSHLYFKRAFVDPKKPMEIWQVPKEDGGMLRQYIPAKLEDNPTLMNEDPTYEDKIYGLGSPELVRAMRNGDWGVVSGAYFTEWDEEKHVIEPFSIPSHWLRFRGFDWGSAKPFSCHWLALSDGIWIDENGKHQSHFIPKDSLVIYREWYGKSEDNKGLKLDVSEVAFGIIKRSPPKEKIAYSVSDPSIFKEDGGPSIAELFAKNGVRFRRGDNNRLAGWEQIRRRLNGIDGKPLLYVFDTCRDLIRTFPAMIHDEYRPEDLNSDLEDHALDSCRYSCMSRPYGSTPKERKEISTKLTFNDLLKLEGRF